MTNEIKERIKSSLYLLFLPITGFYFLIEECKNDNYKNFFCEWFAYMMMLIAWCGSIAIINLGIWGLIYHFDTAILPVSIIGGGVFVFFILPVIIHKLIHKK
jgi:hypothetical protein